MQSHVLTDFPRPAFEVVDSGHDQCRSSRASLSVVVPCFNEQAVIEATHQRLAAALEPLDCDVEIIYVNDGSNDRTFELLRQLHGRDRRVTIVNLARNFGHQLALTAGLDRACGDAVVLIDADLQDPPEAIPLMFELWRQGYEVVYGQRTKRAGEPKLRLAAIRLFYRLLSASSETPVPMDAGDFRLLDRKVVEALRHMPEHDRYLRGMISWAGFRQVALPYERQQRFAGESKYPLTKLIQLGANGLVSFSLAPLRIATAAGILALAAAVVAFFAMLLSILRGAPPTGTTWQALALATLAGTQLFCVGILGEYIGRIYREIKQRPLYIVSQTLPRRSSDDESSRRAA